MPLKQAAFNFDFEPEENIPAQKETAVPSPRRTEPVRDLTSPAAPPAVRDALQEMKKSTRGRMKLSDMDADTVLQEIPDDETLAQKSYYSIGEVSTMFQVNQSLLRFWETEFSILKPKKNGKGDRFYRPEDIRNLKMIYHLLRERKYTIDGAREFMKNSKHAERKFELINSLKSLKNFLTELKANL